MPDDFPETPNDEPKMVTLKQVMEIMFKAFSELNIHIDLSEYVTKEEFEAKIKELESRMI